MDRRVIDWPFDVELPFGNPPSVRIPGPEELRADVAAGREWLWLYRGLAGVLTLPVMKNALQAWDDFRDMHPRTARPKHIGKFLWMQVVCPGNLHDAANEKAAGIAAAAMGGILPPPSTDPEGSYV